MTGILKSLRVGAVGLVSGISSRDGQRCTP